MLIDVKPISVKSLPLTGDQFWSSSGPVSLAVVLQYWGSRGSVSSVLDSLMPNPQDENVMAYELVNYVETRSHLRVLSRMGGNIDLLRALTRAGFPVIVEKGHTISEKEGWVGHYQVVLGYESQWDTIAVKVNWVEPGAELIQVKEFERDWRAFNYAFLVVYPPEEESTLNHLLGDLAAEGAGERAAAQKASEEIYQTNGVDHFFAWNNRGVALAELDDFEGAAKAFDQAFIVYNAIPEDSRPWRILWYQTRPYWAYYYTGRYEDLIDLATRTLSTTSNPALEESLYWRALAREAVGDLNGAVTDLRQAVKVNPHFTLGLEQLKRLTGKT